MWAEIARVLPEDTLLVPGQGDFDYWADAVLPVRRPGHYVRSGRSGCLGAEIPFGIAAKLARPDAPVLVTVGDGGFGFSPNISVTPRRHRGHRERIPFIQGLKQRARIPPGIFHGTLDGCNSLTYLPL